MTAEHIYLGQTPGWCSCLAWLATDEEVEAHGAERQSAYAAWKEGEGK